jgi:hypothetical protein
MISSRSIPAVLLFALLILFPAGAFPVSRDAADCGRSVGGVQICLASAGSTLELALRNVGEHDVTLNLGYMLSNGKVQLPSRLAVKFTDAHGQTRTFQFADKRYPFIAGRVDDFVVPLRTGSTYTLQLTLDQFWCQETKEFSIPLLSGENYLAAQFEGSGAHLVNSDMPGIRLMKFWVGEVESNMLTLRR